MSDAFLKLLQSSQGLPGIGIFDSVFREVNCRQGRPDFITMRTTSNQKIKPLPEMIGLVGSSILSMLKLRSPRTLEYILARSEFSANSVTRSLMQLLSSWHIDKTETGSYVLGAASDKFSVELWAFELKLGNPKRAIFQAQQSRAFAECSIIVAPPSQTENYERYSETMARWGIGLVAFDPCTRSFSIERKPRKSKAFSRQHRIYAIAKLFSKNLFD